MKLTVYNQKAKQVGEIEVKEFTQDNRVNDKVLSQYVYIYLSNQRQGNANVKDRAEVSGGGKKPYAQKGTGRARAGSIRSPIWKGGGVTFGPSNTRNWKKKTTKNFRTAAFRNAFSKLVNENLLKIVDSVSIDEKDSLTKQAIEMMKDFDAKKLTLVTSENNENLVNAFSNLKKGKVVTVNKVNPYDLLVGGLVVVDQKSLDYINERWGNA